MENQKIPIVVIGGPTASGKTALAVETAKKINGEIISADSVQIYKYLNIGSAKPTAEEMQGIRHYMIDFLDPSDSFSAADFTSLAHGYAEDIYSRGKIPIVAGGTGLYISSLINDVEFLDEQTDEKLRSELFDEAERKGAHYMHEELRKIDPAAADAIHENNVVRVIRAIEFYKATGIPISVHQSKTREKESRYLPCMIAIEHDRKILYDRINRRVDRMFKDGLIDEVRDLVRKGYKKTLCSMKGIGYKEVIDYLRGFMTYDELSEILKKRSRRYAKRQLTWFKKDKRYTWVRYSDSIVDDTLNVIKNQLGTVI